MRTELNIEECFGKTLEGFATSWTTSQAVLTFSDGTFATLRVDHSYDGDSAIEGGTLSINDFGDEKLIDLDIISRAELRAMREEKDRKEAAKQAAAERAQFERLRAKFEGRSHD